jgi:hypothetical protein
LPKQPRSAPASAFSSSLNHERDALRQKATWAQADGRGPGSRRTSLVAVDHVDQVALQGDLAADRYLTDSFRADPTRTDEQGDIAVVRDVGERCETMRHPGRRCSCRGPLRRSRTWPLLPGPKNTARRDASSTAVFGGLAHWGIEARDACGTLGAEGDADRGRREVQRPAQRFAEPPPVRHITTAMSLSSCTRARPQALAPQPCRPSRRLRSLGERALRTPTSP